MDRGGDPLEFRHADPVKFGTLVAGLGPDYEEHGSKSRYRSPTRTVPRRNGRGVSIAYRPIRKIK